MTAHLTVTAEFQDRPIASLRTLLDRSDKREAFRAIVNELHGILTGRRAMVRAVLSGVCATGTYTATQATLVSGTSAATIAGTVLVAETTPVDQDDFAIGTTDAEAATNLCNAINAHTTLQKIVRASVSSNIVTVTCIFPGPIGNLVTTTETSNGLVVSGAALTGGTSDEADAYQLGYVPAV